MAVSRATDASGDTQSPLPTSGVGPDDSGRPQGASAPRDLAWFMARIPPDFEASTLATAADWNRESVAAFIANHSPKETPDA